MKQITKYGVIDHGIDNAQYFPGCGIAFTGFDDVVTGCGDNFIEALDIALDDLAELDYEIKSGLDYEIINEFAPGKPSMLPNAHDDCHRDCEHVFGDECEDHDSCELYYYVSIRVKG